MRLNVVSLWWSARNKLLKYMLLPLRRELAGPKCRVCTESAEVRAESIRRAAEGSIRKDSETLTNVDKSTSPEDQEKVRELEKEVLDLKITNRAKDFLIRTLASVSPVDRRRVLTCST